MSLSAIGVRPPANLQATSATPPSPQREAWSDLRRALRTDDLPAARQAYVSLIKNAPQGATFPRDSNFAELGKALAGGDVGAAKEAFRAMQLARWSGAPPAPLPPAPLPAEQAGGVDLFA